MAIVVVKEPIAQKAVQFSCRKQDCQAELAATKRDGTYRYDSRDGDFVEFDCPFCGSYIAVKATLFDEVSK